MGAQWGGPLEKGFTVYSLQAHLSLHLTCKRYFFRARVVRQQYSTFSCKRGLNFPLHTAQSSDLLLRPSSAGVGPPGCRLNTLVKYTEVTLLLALKPVGTLQDACVYASSPVLHVQYVAGTPSRSVLEAYRGL